MLVYSYYSCISRKLPPKMWRLSGNLWELNQTTGGSLLFQEEVPTHLIFKCFYYTKFLSYNMCGSMLLLKFFCILWVTQYTEQTERSNHAWSIHLKEVKNNRNLLTHQPQKVIVVADRRWSFMRGGCLWEEVVAHRRSTAFTFGYHR